MTYWEYGALCNQWGEIHGDKQPEPPSPEDFEKMKARHIRIQDRVKARKDGRGHSR